jgi:hypothetical protein
MLKGAGEDSDCGARREREKRLRPLAFEILPSPEENVQKIGRSNSSCQITNRSWTVRFPMSKKE